MLFAITNRLNINPKNGVYVMLKDNQKLCLLFNKKILLNGEILVVDDISNCDMQYVYFFWLFRQSRTVHFPEQ